MSLLRAWPLLAGLLGGTLAIVLIAGVGADAVLHSMLLIGWGLLPVTLFHTVPLVLSALSWRDLLPAKKRLGVIAVALIRWIRESVNTLLPAASVSGDFVCLRLAHLRGVPATPAAASMIVDITIGAATQLLFAFIGTALLLARTTDPAAVALVWILAAAFGLCAVGTVIFIVTQQRGMVSASARFAGRVLGIARVSAFAGAASAIDDAVVRLYRDPASFYRASVLRFLGWAAGTGEVWLVLQFLKRPTRLIDAFILESVGAGVRAVAFMVPAQLGVLEGGFVVVGALFGIPAGAALAISFSRRVRELALGIPGLIVWQWIEGRHLLRRRNSG